MKTKHLLTLTCYCSLTLRFPFSILSLDPKRCNGKIWFWLLRSVADVVDDGPIADWVKITVKETVSYFCTIATKHRLFVSHLESYHICFFFLLLFENSQENSFEVFALVPGLLRHEVSTPLKPYYWKSYLRSLWILYELHITMVIHSKHIERTVSYQSSSI